MNGTFLNGVPVVAEETIVCGDTISLLESTFVMFRLQE